MKGGFFMATTRLMPCTPAKAGRWGRPSATLSTMFKIRRKQTTAGSLPAINVTVELRMRSSFFNKRQYIAATGRVRARDDVIAYHLRQSFVPGEMHAGRSKPAGLRAGAAFRPRGNTPSLSVPILTKNTSIITSFSMPPLWTTSGSFGTFGAAPARSGGSMIPSA